MGTPQYMAPEQLFAEPVDHRNDLYAAGAVLYECVTGRVVFEGTSMGEIAAVPLRETPPDPESLNARVPATLSAIILRALARRPDDRWESAGEPLHALEAM